MAAAKDRLAVGPLSAAPGTAVTGLVRIGELADGVTPIQVPLVLVNGALEGPTIYLHAGSHGQETPYAVAMMARLRRTIDPGRLRGAIVAVPVANLLAHQFATRVPPPYAAREGVAFAGDLHKLWPGDPAGSMTQRIADFLWREAVSRATCAIDFHAVGEPGIPFLFLYRGGRRDCEGSEVWARACELASAFGFTAIATAPNPLTLGGSCLDAGKPCFMVEMTRGRNLDDSTVDAALRGTLNVLKRLGMVDGDPEPQAGFPVLPGLRRALPTLRAGRGGFVRFEAPCGEWLPSGTVVARICDVFGEELEAVAMPTDGYVMTYPAMSWVANQAVATGDLIADVFI